MKKTKSVWASDKLINKRWPNAEIVWTSITMDIQVVKTGEQWGYGDVYRVVEADRCSHMYTYSNALLEAIRREMFTEERARS